MIIRITKPITCNDTFACHQVLQNKIETVTGLKLHAENETEKTEGYVYVLHKQNNHLILVCCYDSNQHEVISEKELKEFDKTGIIIERPVEKQPNTRLKKILTTLPTKPQIEAAL